MKLITFEVSDHSLAVTTVNRISGEWICSVLLSQQSAGWNEVTHTTRRLLGGVDDPEAALEMAKDFTHSYIESHFPEFAAEE